MLSDRRQKVLQALIEEYVANAQPVGSRTLVDRYRLGVSAATVRNELSVLEDEGYLTSPHTSAGRIPTDAGYRAFVDEILDRELAEEPKEGMFDELREAAVQVDDLVSQTSAALSRLTDCLSVVMAPSLLGAAVKQISLVSFTPYRMLMVVVTDDGQVLNHNVDFREEVSAEELAHLQNVLNNVLSGHSFSEIRGEEARRMTEALSSPLARLVVDELLMCLSKADEGRARKLGLSALLSKPEFRHTEAALPILRALEDDTVLMHLFDDVAVDGKPLEVRIGSENTASQLSGVSVVAAQYGSGMGDGHGVVAVIGPTRMDYSRVINAVRAAKSALRDL